jgi:hypothetical protein
VRTRNHNAKKRTVRRELEVRRREGWRERDCFPRADEAQEGECAGRVRKDHDREVRLELDGIYETAIRNGRVGKGRNPGIASVRRPDLSGFQVELQIIPRYGDKEKPIMQVNKKILAQIGIQMANGR